MLTKLLQSEEYSVIEEYLFFFVCLYWGLTSQSTNFQSCRSNRFLGNFGVLSECKVSCSRTQHGGGRFRTPDLSLRSPILYHWATALPHRGVTRNLNTIYYDFPLQFSHIIFNTSNKIEDYIIFTFTDILNHVCYFVRDSLNLFFIM